MRSIKAGESSAPQSRAMDRRMAAIDGKLTTSKPMQTANQIAVVDISQMKVVRTVQVGADPVQILVRPGLA